MSRFHTLASMGLAVALVAAACGGDAPVVTTDSGSAAETSVDATATTAAEQTASDVEESPDTSDTEADPGTGDGDDAPVVSDSGDEEPSGTTAAAPAVDSDEPDGSPGAEALLASVATGLAGRSVRGEATVEAPVDTGPTGVLTTRFELDAEGDLATTLEIPPGVEPDLPQGGETQFRYVGGEQYLMVPEPIATSMGLDAGGGPVWLIVKTSAIDGAPTQGELGVLCVFPQLEEAPTPECDPVAGASNLAAVAEGAAVVGREEVRGVETTRVSFAVPLLKMLGEALGDIPDDTAEMVEAEAFAGMFEELLSGLEITAEFWIDDNSLIRRMSLDLSAMMMEFPGTESDDLPSFSLTLEFYDFDADISVEAPPPELVVGDTGLLG